MTQSVEVGLRSTPAFQQVGQSNLELGTHGDEIDVSIPVSEDVQVDGGVEIALQVDADVVELL